MPELVFTVADGAPPAYRQLAESLVARANAQDAAARLTEARPADPRPDRVFVVLGALPGLEAEPQAVRKRTIQITGAAPGTPEAAAAEAIAPSIGLTLHPNFAAARRLAAAGLRATHLQLGYEPGWDAYDPASEATVETIRCEGEAPYFDWLGALLAIHRGAVVLHERSLAIAPLVPGRQVYVAAAENLEALAAALGADPARRKAAAAAAHEFIAKLLPMEVAGSSLLGHARTLLVEPID